MHGEQSIKRGNVASTSARRVVAVARQVCRALCNSDRKRE